jgi:hypothetical protein
MTTTHNDGAAPRTIAVDANTIVSDDAMAAMVRVQVLEAQVAELRDKIIELRSPPVSTESPLERRPTQTSRKRLSGGFVALSVPRGRHPASPSAVGTSSAPSTPLVDLPGRID